MFLCYRCFLVGPLGFANGFFSSVPLPARPSSARRNDSLSSWGSDVSTFLAMARPMFLAAARTEETPDENNMRCLIGDVDGQEYMNTGGAE